jgi:hypothetical protein
MIFCTSDQIYRLILTSSDPPPVHHICNLALQPQNCSVISMGFGKTGHNIPAFLDTSDMNRTEGLRHLYASPPCSTDQNVAVLGFSILQAQTFHHFRTCLALSLQLSDLPTFPSWAAHVQHALHQFMHAADSIENAQLPMKAEGIHHISSLHVGFFSTP